MSDSSTIPLHRLKTILWNDVQQSIGRENFSSVSRYILNNGGENPPKIQVSLTKGDYFEPEKIFCEIQIHHYPCKIKGKKGIISAIFSIPNVEIHDCTIDDKLVHVDYISDEFWEQVDMSDIERFVASEWNQK